MMPWTSPCGCCGYVMRTVAAVIKVFVPCGTHTDAPPPPDPAERGEGGA